MNHAIAGRLPEVGATSAPSPQADPAALFSSEADFRAWYEATAPRVYAYLHGRCGGDVHLAEELTQQTFVSAIRSRSGFRGHSDPVTWVIAIARSRLVDHYRRLARDERRHLRIVVGEIGRASATEEAAWHEADTREEVLAALRALPAEQRAAMVLHHMDGLSVREVAQQLDRSEPAVESLLARARRRFRQVYGGDDHA